MTLVVLAGLWVALLALDLRSLLRTGTYENRPGRLVKLVTVTTVSLLVALPGRGDGGVTLLRAAFVVVLLGDACFSAARRFVPGVLLFSGVQVLLTVRHLAAVAASAPAPDALAPDALASDAALGVLLAVLLGLGGGVSAWLRPRLGTLGLVVATYAAVSAVSVWAAAVAVARAAPTVDGAWALAGVTLLGACDVCVGLRLVLRGPRREWVGLAVWALYVPALVALGASGPTLLRP